MEALPRQNMAAVLVNSLTSVSLFLCSCRLVLVLDRPQITSLPKILRNSTKPSAGSLEVTSSGSSVPVSGTSPDFEYCSKGETRRVSQIVLKTCYVVSSIFMFL